MEFVLWFLAVVCVLIGIAGTLLPALPGTPLVFIGLLLAAWAGDFAWVGWPTLLVLGLLTVVSLGADLMATAAGARRTGASPRAVLGASLGTVGGLFFGLPGLLAGPFIGAAAGELSIGRTPSQAGRAGAGAWAGLMLGAVLKVALVFAMLGVFLTGALI